MGGACPPLLVGGDIPHRITLPRFFAKMMMVIVVKLLIVMRNFMFMTMVMIMMDVRSQINIIAAILKLFNPALVFSNRISFVDCWLSVGQNDKLICTRNMSWVATRSTVHVWYFGNITFSEDLLRNKYGKIQFQIINTLKQKKKLTNYCNVLGNNFQIILAMHRPRRSSQHRVTSDKTHCSIELLECCQILQVWNFQISSSWSMIFIINSLIHCPPHNHCHSHHHYDHH